MLILYLFLMSIGTCLRAVTSFKFLQVFNKLARLCSYQHNPRHFISWKGAAVSHWVQGMLVPAHLWVWEQICRQSLAIFLCQPSTMMLCPDCLYLYSWICFSQNQELKSTKAFSFQCMTEFTTNKKKKKKSTLTFLSGVASHKLPDVHFTVGQ